MRERGLASLGRAIALFIALWLNPPPVVEWPIVRVLARIVAPFAIAACFIRLGNLMNSEIVGDPSTAPWAFSFPHYWNDTIKDFDDTPRHPAQLYEAISYIFIFVFLMFLYWKKKMYEKRGVLFGAFLILLFGARFLVEFIKLGQTDRDDVLAINTGQILSIPFILAGIFILWKGLKKERIQTNVDHLKVAEAKK